MASEKTRIWDVSLCIRKATVFVVCFSLMGCSNQPNPARPAATDTTDEDSTDADATNTTKAAPLFEPQVAQGDNIQALRYYNLVMKELDLDGGLVDDALVDSINMQRIIKFLGYEDLQATDVERLPSDELMQKSDPGDIVASRFFAPKITDVAKSDGSQQEPDKINLGWRKLVRFKAKGDARTEHKLLSAFLLFNVFESGADPFEKFSLNTQMMLVREKPDGGFSNDFEDANHSAFFMVFGPLFEEDEDGEPQPLEDGGKLILSLNATFDARAPEIEDDKDGHLGTVRSYFVPDACAHCHGGFSRESSGSTPTNIRFGRIKLNYLDTDHWFDRVQPGDDFAEAIGSKHVLFDGGAPGTPEFETAFGVLRDLNSDILTQNEETLTGSAIPFQVRAARKWRDLHAPSGGTPDSTHKGIHLRGIGNDPVWAADTDIPDPDDPDNSLLRMLNRYCFRCHSSLRYSVFDRRRVKGFASQIPGLLDQDVADRFRMPQDRKLPPEVIAKLKSLLATLDAQ